MNVDGWDGRRFRSSSSEPIPTTHPTNPIRYRAQGNRNRTTKATEVNDVSSRSHAICQIVLRARESGRMYGKLSLVDLAGAVWRLGCVGMD